MPDETIVNPPVQEAPANIKVPPNFDNELDAALEKSFKNFTSDKTKENNEEQKKDIKSERVEVSAEDKKPIQDGNKDIKVEEKPSKPLEVDKALPNPESVDEEPKGKGQAAWTALKNNYKRSFKQNEEKDQEITKIKGVLAEKEANHKKEIEALRTEREELSKYRAMVDIQADPEFVSKFDQPIEKSINSIKQMLKEMDVNEAVINQIDFNNTKLMEDIVNKVSEHRDKFVAKKLQRKMEDLFDLNDKRNETLDDQKKNYKELLETKKKDAFSKETENEGRMIKHLENVTLGKDKDGNAKHAPIAFLNKMSAKDGATQPEIDQINNHNAMVDMMQKKVKDGMRIETPEDKMEMVVAAVGSIYLSAQLKAAMAKIASLEGNLKKVSNVNSETEKSRTVSPRANGNIERADIDTALRNHFAKK